MSNRPIDESVRVPVATVIMIVVPLRMRISRFRARLALVILG